ncbi:tektin-4-like [Anticarsia gemmatalis]|uniref:tektin-4-like n=1 Tax=Anticarsia gemmatalis TaxID=129554 RepID=UPI003F76A8F3
MELTTFPEKDICPEECYERGGFRKSPKSTQEIADQLKAVDDVRHSAQREAYKQRNDRFEHLLPIEPEIEVVTTFKSLETHLPQLKPHPDSGKIDWTPLAGLTGTRPNVSKYSISRYSLDEWRKHNNDILDQERIYEANILDYNAQTAITAAFGTVDKKQQESVAKQKQKAKDLFRWKVEVEQACKEMAKEVELLEHDRQRLKSASRVLMLPESISKECMELRSNRGEKDLVEDQVEKELIVEMKLVSEVRETIITTLRLIEEQLAIDKAAKHRIEYDWCDKTEAYNTESKNLSLNNHSSTIMFVPGATKFGDYTAPLSYWEYYCRENIQNVEAVRQKSVDLRGSLIAILINNGRKLRQQADKTDIALAETVAHTTEMLTKLQNDLRDTLRTIADVELLIQKLQDAIRKMDRAMKLAQTRLANRNQGRPHGENVRDVPHLGLIDEVKTIHETVSGLMGQLNSAEISRKKLMEKRIEIEAGISSKLKTLNIDRERCGLIRSHYPSASELAGL